MAGDTCISGTPFRVRIQETSNPGVVVAPLLDPGLPSVIPLG